MTRRTHDPEPGNAFEAYLLVQTQPGKAHRVVDRTRTTAGITGADAVTGPYDVIARARAASIEDLQSQIISRVNALDGIIRVLVSPIVRG